MEVELIKDVPNGVLFIQQSTELRGKKIEEEIEPIEISMNETVETIGT